jgi:hypothetical protein
MSPMDDESLNTVGSHCPTCGQEYRPGFTVCADDGTELVPGPAPVPEEDDGEPDVGGGAERADVADLSSDVGPPVELGTFPIQDAVLLAGRLRSLGVPAMSESDVDLNPYRNVPGMGGTTRVFVRPEDLERARRIVRRIQSGASDDEADDDPDDDGDS